jgi:hypothetical protein
VLVIMQDREGERRLQALLDFKASWSRNILELNGSKGRRNCPDSLDERRLARPGKLCSCSFSSPP